MSGVGGTRQICSTSDLGQDLILEQVRQESNGEATSVSLNAPSSYTRFAPSCDLRFGNPHVSYLTKGRRGGGREDKEHRATTLC